MEHYLINSSVCLFVLWIFYKLVLENTSWHRFKRWYLLGSIVIAVAIPFIVVKTMVIPVQETPVFIYETPVNYDFQQPVDTAIVSVVSEERPFDWKLLLIGLYALGVFIMGYRFVRNLNQFKLQTDDEVESYSNYRLVLRSLVTIPHSFINRIFVSKTAYKNNDIPLEILEHEKAHLDQKHSYDILFIELLLVVFWFHPVLYVLRYSMKLNHEFLADQAVLEKGKDTTDYQELLLSYSQQVHSKQLAHTFNYPIIKKRFQVMKTKTSFSNGLLRGIALMAVIAGLVVACGKARSKTVEVNAEGKEIVYISNLDDEGTLSYEGKEYRFTNNSTGIIIYDSNDDEIDWYQLGWDVRETLDHSTERFDYLTGLVDSVEAGNTMVYIDDRIATRDELNSIMNASSYSSDSFTQYIDNGIKYVRFTGLKISDLKNEYIDLEYIKKNIPEATVITVNEKKYYYITKNDQTNIYNLNGELQNHENKDFADIVGQVLVQERAKIVEDSKESPVQKSPKLTTIKENNQPSQSDQLLARKMIIKTARTLKEKPIFKLNGNRIDDNKLDEFIEKNPYANIEYYTDKARKAVLNFAPAKKQIMTVKKLDKLYAALTKEDIEILDQPKMTTDDLNRSKDSLSKMSFYVQVDNEPDSEDFKMRRTMIMSSLDQTKPLNYLLNGKKTSINAIQEYLVKNETADVDFIEGQSNTLSFSDNDGTVMKKTELQEVYTKIFKYKSKEPSTVAMAISPTAWKVVTVDAAVSKGTFERKGKNYTYDSSDHDNIKVYDSNNKQLSDQEFKNLALGFSIVWFNGKEKYAELIRNPEIKKAFEKGAFAVFYEGGYTTDYKEALKVDASDMFLRMGSTLEGETINLHPHSWAYTNPSLKLFQKYLKK